MSSPTLTGHLGRGTKIIVSESPSSASISIADLDPLPRQGTPQAYADNGKNFTNTKPVQQDRPSHLSSRRRQEDLYLAQARLLQWYLMSKKASRELMEQEQEAKTEQQELEKDILEKQVRLRDLQQRIAVERELVDLESNLGRQREQLMSVVNGLEDLRPEYEDTLQALERETNLSSIPLFEDRHLDHWLVQIRNCQSSLETTSKKTDSNRSLLKGLALFMREMCIRAQEEIQELQQCASLLIKLREAKETEQRLQGIAVEPQITPTSSEMSIPVQQLLQPNNEVIGLLSGLSVQDLAAMEATLHRAKMVRMQSIDMHDAVAASASAPSFVQDNSHQTSHQSAPIPASTSHQKSIQGLLSVMNPTSRTLQSSSAPELRVNGSETYLHFTYSSKSVHKEYTIKAGIDAVLESEITIETRNTNCLYPGANGPEQDYKGSRLGYERDCNLQGWKLVLLNPGIFDGKKGLLQRAVISLRNATSEQKSRRVKRKEKAVLQESQRSSTVVIPERSSISAQRHIDSPTHGHQLHDLPHQDQQRQQQLTWQLPLTPRFPRATQRPIRGSRPDTQDLVPATTDRYPLQSQHQLSSIHPEAQNWQQLLPTLGSFNPISEIDLKLEFEGYINGRFKNLTILCDVNQVQVEDLSFDFKKANCVYPRSFLTENVGLNLWNSFGVKQAEENYLNELGWKLKLLGRKRLLLQRALDAYRRKFLPLTCHPRARIGASFFTRRNSLSAVAPFESVNPEPQRRKSKPRIHFDLEDDFQDLANKYGVGDDEQAIDGSEEEDDDDQAEDEENEEGDEDEDDEEEDEGDDDEQGDADDDSDNDGGSSEGEDSLSGEGFHSRMSLLTFTGSIQTYSLGTGSGSARSRPRIAPSDTNTGPLPSLPLPVSSQSTTSRKHSRAVSQSVADHSTSSSTDVSKKRRKEAEQDKRRSVGNGAAEDGKDSDAENGRDGSSNEGDASGTDIETETEEEYDHASYNEQDEEDNWWKSRLDNSEYPEDHDFVGLTTEELIGALTSGYVDEEDDDDDDDDD
ncbi:hypothetical protein BGZ83_003511 [Gryganskiella cystojenkinii]|nr:hypothetical protein BGZ83_003511 [Gryganskiella cystojenkinii]